MTIWISVKNKLPDDELTVLLAMADGEVWTGFHEDDQWFYASADPVGSEVTHWADFPPAPTDPAKPGLFGQPNVDKTHKGDLRRVLRDLLATIELQTDCMSNTVDRAALDPWIERAEDLLGETLEEIIT